MKLRRTLLSASIVAALGLSAGANAQEAAAAKNQDVQQIQSAEAAAAPEAADQPSKMETVEVIGIRASLKASLDTKRDADAIVDAITAEDIGKFPSTNVAEAMSQIPGVTIDRRFGQGERVSINGADPSLNLSFLDGHPVAQTTWLYGEQPNRGFDYTLLAPELLGKLEVYKSAEARLPEGSIGGTVIMHTRQPLDLKENTIAGSVGITYGDQSKTTKPTVSGLFSWKNDAHTFGVAVSAQHYEEKVDRQGTEIFGYRPVSFYAANSPAIAAQVASGQLRATDLVPDEVNAAYFQQDRKRDSVAVNLQFKPSDELEVGLSALYIKENFDNFNQSMYNFQAQDNGIASNFVSSANGVVQSGHVCSSVETASCAAQAHTYLDNQARTSEVTSKGLDLRAAYRGDGWRLSGQIGESKADDGTNSQAFIEPFFNGAYSWNLRHGVTFDRPAVAADPHNWHCGEPDGWCGNNGQWSAHAKDTYGQFDFSHNLDWFFNEILVGARYAKHDESRELFVWGGVRPANPSVIGFDHLTDILNNFPGFSPDQQHHIEASRGRVIDWVLGSPIDFAHPVASLFIENTYDLSQKSNAAYVQGNFGEGDLRGNLGVRFVRTEIDSSAFDEPSSVAPTFPPAASSLVKTNTSHNNVLPAFNVAYNASETVVLRAAAAEVIAFAPYNQEVNNTFLNDTVLTGSGGNANLNPFRSINVDLSAEWYFADQSVLAGSVFYKDVLNYITTDVAVEHRFNNLSATDPTTFNRDYVGHLGNCGTNGFCDYSVLRPRDGGRATVKGFTVSYQQPFGDSGFGLQTNYTYANGTTKAGTDLPYNSRNAINVSPYFEKGPFSARVTYGWRAKYLAGGYVAGAPPATVSDYTELDASAGWRVTDNISLNFDAQNLLDESYVQYLGSKDLPANKYKTGRRYMFALRFQF